MGHGALQISRMCGEARQEGGIYMENGGGSSALEEFLLCPSRKIPDSVNVPARGVFVFELNGKKHVIDMIGMNSYPWPVIWLEETRIGGVSRRVKPEVAGQLEEGSMMLIAHRRAYIDNFQDYSHVYSCPINKEIHQEPKEIEDLCVSYFWEDLEMNKSLMTLYSETPEYKDKDIYEKRGYALERMVRFNHPERPFFLHLREKQITPQYYERGAIFAIFPITRFTIVKARDGSHKKTLDKVSSNTNICVDEVEA